MNAYRFEEGGTRVPFLVAWAGEIAPGTTSDALLGVSDVYATFAALAGVELSADEGVDSEDVSAALRGEASGDSRQSSLIYKTRDRLTIRNGNLKLVATESDSDRDGSRFDGNLDFADLEAFRLYDLGQDLGETNNLVNDPAFAATVEAMLAELQGHVDRGFTRAGAVANANGTNFQGGDLLSTDSYTGYGDGGTLELPKLTRENPSFVYVDGTAGDRVEDAWIVQGNGEVVFDGDRSGVDGGRYELRGGSVTADTAFRVDDSRFTVAGGDLDVNQRIRLTKGDGLLELLGGTAEADRVSFGELAGATAGSKVVRFGLGRGAELTLLDADPLGFGDDGSADDDYVDFVTGSTGSLLTRLDADALGGLYDGGFLRVDGDSSAGGFDALFEVTDAGSGFTRLALATVPEPATAALLGLGLLTISGRRR